MARLWIVSELYYPELTSTGYYITAIAESLATDLEVDVICGQPNYSARAEKAPAVERRNNVDICRVASLRLNKNVLFFRVLNMLSLSLSIFLREVLSFKKGDSVLVVTTPPLLPFAAAAAALIRGAGYTLLVHDLYPEQLIATGILKKNSMIASPIDVMNRWVYKHARTIITVGRDMKERLETKASGLEVPIAYIPNWAETHKITPEAREQNGLLRELDLNNKFVVLCAGNLGRPSDFETIVEAAKHVDERVQFLFIGGGVKERYLRDAAAGSRNLTVLGPMPRDQQQVFLNACDVTIVSLVRGMLGAAVPSRVYSYLAAGKPVIAVCEAGSELARIIDEEQVGKWVEPDDVSGLARAINDLANSPHARTSMGRKARSAAETKYSPDVVLPRFHDLLVPSE